MGKGKQLNIYDILKIELMFPFLVLLSRIRGSKVELHLLRDELVNIIFIFYFCLQNLETVKVVKRAQDSVIYKNYSRKMSVTIEARENKRLQRMHTVPIMTHLPSIPMELEPTLETTTEM